MSDGAAPGDVARKNGWLLIQAVVRQTCRVCEGGMLTVRGAVRDVQATGGWDWPKPKLRN